MNSSKTLFKHMFKSRRAEAEGEEDIYEDYLSCLEELQE
jgi:hypothetical protein